jgi:hypothetical protein
MRLLGSNQAGILEVLGSILGRDICYTDCGISLIS